MSINERLIRPAKKYPTNVSGCVISSDNGYYESLASQKHLEVHMPNPVALSSGEDPEMYTPPALLPSNLTIKDLRNLTVYVTFPDETVCDIVARLGKKQAGEILLKMDQQDYIYHPNTGVFISHETIEAMNMDSEEEPGDAFYYEVYSAMTGEEIAPTDPEESDSSQGSNSGPGK